MSSPWRPSIAIDVCRLRACCEETGVRLSISWVDDYFGNAKRKAPSPRSNASLSTVAISKTRSKGVLPHIEIIEGWSSPAAIWLRHISHPSAMKEPPPKGQNPQARSLPQNRVNSKSIGKHLRHRSDQGFLCNPILGEEQVQQLLCSMLGACNRLESPQLTRTPSGPNA